MKRTPQNCTIADKVYDRDAPSRYDKDGKCAGIRKTDDEPIEVCRECKLNMFYEEE